MDVVIQSRRQQLINTDPQRRCYDGCNYSEALVWTPWVTHEYVDADRAEARLKFWQGLNDYAVKERGKSARQEFRITQ